MKTTIKNVFVAAGLAALAVPIIAQGIDPRTPKPTAHASVRSKKHQPKRAAQLKTGQLITRPAAHLETKEASLHHQIHSDREHDRKLTPDDQAPAQTNQQNTNTTQIHLKKHNARMF